mmetsp:Transcript_25539/g.64023  ORF Transcript_25539/g.64023 Transcript_25539/m.64023 type:complete len:211 (-) Transcript_25539:2919-3551(-)
MLHSSVRLENVSHISVCHDPQYIFEKWNEPAVFRCLELVPHTKDRIPVFIFLWISSCRRRFVASSWGSALWFTESNGNLGGKMKGISQKLLEGNGCPTFLVVPVAAGILLFWIVLVAGFLAVTTVSRCLVTPVRKKMIQCQDVPRCYISRVFEQREWDPEVMQVLVFPERALELDGSFQFFALGMLGHVRASSATVGWRRRSGGRRHDKR